MPSMPNLPSTQSGHRPMCSRRLRPIEMGIPIVLLHFHRMGAELGQQNTIVTTDAMCDTSFTFWTSVPFLAESLLKNYGSVRGVPNSHEATGTTASVKLLQNIEVRSVMGRNDLYRQVLAMTYKCPTQQSHAQAFKCPATLSA